MEINKDSLFLELLSKNIISLVFFRDGVRIRVEKQEEYDNYFEGEEDDVIDEFVSNGFNIASKMKSYLIDNEYIEDEKKEILEEIFKIKPEYKDDLLVRSESKLNLFNTVSYEILTKRDRQDVSNILTYSAMVNLEYSDSNDDLSKSRNITFELTRYDISKLIDKLGNILRDFDNI